MKLKLTKIFLFIPLLFTLSCQNSVTKTPPDEEEQSVCICLKIYAPVCGKDDITYGNSCMAGCKKMSYSEGRCQD